MLSDRKAWLEPSTQEQQQEAAVLAYSLIYPSETKPQAARELAPMLGRYSAAELSYAIREIPYDAELDAKRRYRAELTAADFERIISDMRRLVQQLKRPLLERERNALVDRWPRYLMLEDFEVCKYDTFNNHMYLYTGNRDKPKPTAVRFEVPVTPIEVVS